MDAQCVRCKGRGYCGRSLCPHIIKSNAIFKVKKKLSKEEFLGSSPTPFVGRHGYPYLNVGILSVPEISGNVWEYDSPRFWADNDYDIPSIADLRSCLINSRFKAHAQDSNRMLDIAQEVGMASDPVDIEIRLESKPKFRIATDDITAPSGPNANLKKAEIASNPKIHHKVDKVFSDTDMRSKEAILYLYENSFDENFLTRLLSVGTLGLKKNRRLVPTRWSITATDDIISKNIISKIKDFKETDYTAYFGGYLGNYYIILIFPEKWSYELFEIYMPKASWNTAEKTVFVTDYENYEGRKSYAENTAGGYYAARLAITEKLLSDKVQGAVIALRFITGEYSMPLGVWVVREAVRKALSEKPIKFESKDLMLKYAELITKKKFGADLKYIFRKSRIFDNLKNQTKIMDFF